MTLPNRLGYNSKAHALQKRYLQQQQQHQQQQQLVAAAHHHQFAAVDPNLNYAQQQQLNYAATTQQQQYGAGAYGVGAGIGGGNYPGAQMYGVTSNQMQMMQAAHQQQQLMSSPAHHSHHQMGSPGMSMMPSPSAGGSSKKSKKRKSNANNNNSESAASASQQAAFATPEIQKKKKPKKKVEVNSDNEDASTVAGGGGGGNGGGSSSQQPTPPSIQFGNSGIIKSPKVIKEEIQQINEVFEKAIVALIDRFKNVKIREQTAAVVSGNGSQPSLLTFKEEEKYKPKEEEMITTFPSATDDSCGGGGGGSAEDGNCASTSVAPSLQSLFNSQQQTKLIQNYPIFSLNGGLGQHDDIVSNTIIQEEEKNRKRLFYKENGSGSDYLTVDDLLDEIIRDTDCYFKREQLIHSALSETPNNVISFLHARFLQFIDNNRQKFVKFLCSPPDHQQLMLLLGQYGEFQPILQQFRSIVEHAGHLFEEKTREEASSIVLQSGSTSDVTDEAIDQFPSSNGGSGGMGGSMGGDDLNQDYSKNVSLIEMTPRDILLVFLGKDAHGERNEDVTTFLERFKELQKQYRVECSYIDDGLKKWQDTFERALNSQSQSRVVTFEERHRCKKSLEARFGLMKQLLKDKYLTKVLSLQENTLMRSKRRGNLPRHATNVLKSWLYSHFLHPYPTESEKKDLCMETGLTLTQVNNWFINQRVRTWRPMLESMLDGDQKDKTTPASSSKATEGKKRGKKQNQQQSPIPTPQQQQQQSIPQQQQQAAQMMNQSLLGIPDTMGSPGYVYANWSSNQYPDSNFPFFPGDVADLGSPQQ